MMKKYFKDEFEVPIEAMLEVAGIICEHNIDHIIMEVDDAEGIITLQLEYSKEERETIHKIEDLIADYSPGDDEEDDDEDGEEEEEDD
jgi:hypothetical protein